jgi:formate-dependent nitrite reductase membrane component NrfD
MIWGSIIAWYLFLAGLGAGALTIAALFNLRGVNDARVVQFAGRLLAPAAVIVGLVLLMMDAQAGFKNPLRFFYLLTNFGSVMTWGVAILGLFVIVSVVGFVMFVMKKRIPHWLDTVGLVLALCTAAYTGVLLGVVKTYPFWNNALLPVLFAVSALGSGQAATLIFAEILAKGKLREDRLMMRLTLALPVAEALLLAALLYVGRSSNAAATQSVSSLVSGNLAVLFWLLLVVVGLALPFLLALVRRSAKVSAIPNVTFNVVGEVGVLVGGFMLRYLVLAAAVPLMLLG